MLLVAARRGEGKGEGEGKGKGKGKGGLVGCVGLTLALGDAPGEAAVAELTHLCVDVSCRGQGVGAGLLRAAQAQARDWARELGVRVHLSVLRDQEAALRLYGRGGFLRVGGEVDSGGGAVLLHMEWSA